MLWSQFLSVCLLATSVSAIPAVVKTPVAATPVPVISAVAKTPVAAIPSPIIPAVAKNPVAATPNQIPAITACNGASCEICAPIVANDPLKDLAYQPRKPQQVALTGPSTPLPADKKTTPDPKIPADVKNTTPPPAKALDAKSPSPVLSTRNIREGWFSREECTILQQEAEDGVNFLHLMDTIAYVRDLLLHYGVPWAVSGGLALKIHGMTGRYTGDIDMVVQTDMTTLKGIFKANSWFLLPGPWWPVGGSHLRVYFKYGAFARVARPKYIELDLIVAGGLHTPTDLKANAVPKIKKGTAKKDIIVHTMRLGKIFESKIYALATPHRINKQVKDLKDATWIIDNAPGALVNIPRDVDRAHRIFLLDLLVAHRLPPPTIATAEIRLKADHTPLHRLPPA